MSVELDPFGGPVQVGLVTLRTPGLAGRAEAHAPGSAELRAAESATPELDRALEAQALTTLETIELVDTGEVPVGDVSTRSTSYDEPAIELQVPDPGPAFGQVVLSVDEAGTITWNFAEAEGAERTYLVPRHVPPADGDQETRGLFGLAAKKLLKILVFPLVDPLLGEIGERYAHRWETRRRPYRLRGFAPGTHADAEIPELDAQACGRLGDGRALLLLHGTFSRAHTAFGELPGEFVAELHRRYDGRVFAFDHLTLSEDPRSNVEWLIKRLPEEQRLELDIISHSRGGLVARVLAERQNELSLGSRSIDVRKVVFVGSPNAGTPLADPGHIGDLIDMYTNLLEFFPTNGVTEVLDAVITVVKQVAAGVTGGLSGLASMRPEGTFLVDWMNTPATVSPTYFALASDYRPAHPGLLAMVGRRLVSQVFEKAGNDLVVPTRGVFSAKGTGLFPIAERLVLADDEAVSHSGYFGDARTREQLLAWLG